MVKSKNDVQEIYQRKVQEIDKQWKKKWVANNKNYKDQKLLLEQKSAKAYKELQDSLIQKILSSFRTAIVNYKTPNVQNQY